MGSQGDAGQFRTPRHIIDFIVEIVNPKKNETVLDPACGTAGFLISSYKHILNQNTKNNLGDRLTAGMPSLLEGGRRLLVRGGKEADKYLANNPDTGTTLNMGADPTIPTAEGLSKIGKAFMRTILWYQQSESMDSADQPYNRATLIVER